LFDWSKMRFCPKCHSLLIPRNKRLECKCGYSEDGKVEIKIKVEKPKDIVVVDEDIEYMGESTIPIVCWNCGNRGVYFWMVQIRRADEPPTRFYKCKKCKKVWRSGK